MRNLLEYPITKEEVLEYLETLQRTELDKQTPGNLYPSILEGLIKSVHRDFNPEYFNV